MIFSDSPQQRALERMMTAVPRFLPQGGGTMVRHYFAYTAEMCDCRYCLYYCRKCTADSCPCIEERILAGAAGRSEVMSETMKDIHNAAFRRRLNQFIRESEELPMNFRNEKHRLAFDEAVRKLNKKNFALMAAIYLLTAEHMYEVGFGWDDHVRLRETLGRIKGKFLLSYNDCPEIRELYDGFSLFDFSRTHSMAQRYEAGKEFKELLIANYDYYERENAKPKQLTLFDIYGDENYDYEKILKESIISCKIR